MKTVHIKIAIGILALLLIHRPVNAQNQIMYLKYFNAQAQSGNSVLLKWETSTEINSDFFGVERSTDAQHYTLVGTVKAAGNSTEKEDYSYVDTNPLYGISYYRLKQTDYNGHSVCLPLVMVQINERGASSEVYPNPFDGKEFTLHVYNKQNVSFTLSDSKGEVVYSKNIPAENVFEDVKLPFELTEGTYFLTLSSEKGVERKRLLVKH